MRYGTKSNFIKFNKDGLDSRNVQVIFDLVEYKQWRFYQEVAGNSFVRTENLA